jgi:hypothetical protein
MGKLSYIGGAMYGDGVYVVEFSNVGSTLAPLAATVTGEPLAGSCVKMTLHGTNRPTIGVAGQAIEAAIAAFAEREAARGFQTEGGN